jgi:Flp pilus assembly protein protease CpaA
MNKLKKFDTLATGLIAGIAIPVIVYFIMYFAKVQDVRHTLFSNKLVAANIIPVLISHCVLPNLIIFFIFNGTDWMRAAKGVVAMTVVLTVLLFLMKLLFTIL